MNIEQVQALDYYHDKLVIRRELKSRGITFDYSYKVFRQAHESRFTVMFHDAPRDDTYSEFSGSSEQIDVENWHSASDVRAIGCKARLVRAIKRENRS